jgi:hypothetical protein
MQARRHREYFPFPPLETKPLPAWLEAAPRAEPERPTKGLWIVVGVALVLGLLMGCGYWLSQRGRTSAARIVASAPLASVEPTETPAIPPVPQLVVGLPALSGQTTGSVATQSPVPPPSQPPQLTVGLRPIIGQPSSEAPAPVPVTEAPPPAEPLPSAVPPPKPHRKTNPQPSPDANPSRSSGFVKF